MSKHCVDYFIKDHKGNKFFTMADMCYYWCVDQTTYARNIKEGKTQKEVLENFSKKLMLKKCRYADMELVDEKTRTYRIKKYDDTVVLVTYDNLLTKYRESINIQFYSKELAKRIEDQNKLEKEIDNDVQKFNHILRDLADCPDTSSYNYITSGKKWYPNITDLYNAAEELKNKYCNKRGRISNKKKCFFEALYSESHFSNHWCIWPSYVAIFESMKWYDSVCKIYSEYKNLGKDEGRIIRCSANTYTRSSCLKDIMNSYNEFKSSCCI